MWSQKDQISAKMEYHGFLAFVLMLLRFFCAQIVFNEQDITF